MTPKEIAQKYVYGNHNALTDTQEVADMVKDIETCVSELQKKVNTLVSDVADHVNDKLELKAALVKEQDIHIKSMQANTKSLKKSSGIIESLKAEVKQLEESKESRDRQYLIDFYNYQDHLFWANDVDVLEHRVRLFLLSTSDSLPEPTKTD